ncbi:SRPBCC domain-containing protein [Lacisediminihabitans sp.]|uniref:SRPBCC family protein n=1 Tax=Lacisediminihabitans sp. TaxID=2787631 RepID=UPI00374DCFB8
MDKTTPPTVSDRDVYITRAFAAPRRTVWKFWTSPEHLASWFGPDGFHVPLETVTVELREGGRWDLAMVDEAGNAFPIRGRIVALTEFEYLEIRLDADTGVGDLEDVALRVRFHDHGELTRVTIHQGPFTDEQREQTAEGWELSFVKLDSILEEAGR